MSTAENYHAISINNDPAAQAQHKQLVTATKRTSVLLFIILIVLAAGLIVGIAAFAVRGNRSHHRPSPVDPYARRLPNLQDVKNAVVTYYETNQHASDVWKLSTTFTKHFEDTLVPVAEGGKPKAVVFDIDETLLNNYEQSKRSKFAYDHDDWDAWVTEAHAPVIAGVRALYTYLASKDVKLILITGREEAQRQATIDNLILADIPETSFATLILRSQAEVGTTAAVYKAKHRKALSAEYDIVGCIGDQVSDCVGGYTGYVMKLPNYMYIID